MIARHARRALPALLLAGCAFAAAADQRDPRLPELFASLAHSADARGAEAIERQIWSIWNVTADEEVARLLELGTRAMSEGRLDEAIERFAVVVSRAPDFAEGWNKRATARYLVNDYAGSMLDIERTLALEPRHFGAISGMGLILMDTGDRVGAIKAFEAVLQINPRAPAARRYLHQLRQAAGASGA